MSNFTLYVDLDGVLADFNKTYTKLRTGAPDSTKRFRSAVMDHKIFENLDMMPDAHELLNHVHKLHNVHVEILTSMGTHNPTQAAETKKQKLSWLKKHGISYRPNFVYSKAEKAEYATPTSILIDDSIGCVAPFIAAGGHGILHVNATDSIRMLDSTILQLRAIHA